MTPLHKRIRRFAIAFVALVPALAAARGGAPGVVGIERGSAAAAPQADVVAAATGEPDADAGSWRMIVLNSPTDIPVAAPAAVGSAEYQAELAAIRAAQSQLTREQRQSIDYWRDGGVVRWNEIMLEVVARVDLPPAPRPDGTYPAPNPNNPFADPVFPFANPPYASRAYSYVSVAQFEALKVAWHYKYLYNRPAPSSADGRIEALIPTRGVPSYPSEDAVVSTVNAGLLKILFPTSADQIERAAEAHRQAALLSGKATASDIAAGMAIGQAVVARIRPRMASDGMGQAGGSPAVWQAMADAATARGEIPWRSMEVPPRPPMLPLFGRVRAWMMTPDDIVAERPGPPPSTSSAQMAQEVAEVRQALDNLTREELAVCYKWADGASTPTPPGHWNFIAAEYIREAGWTEVRNARAFALLNMSQLDAAVACWETKFFYFNPRPSQMDPAIRTIIGLPNFPSYTSGHSTFSAAAATVLTYLFPSGREYFEAEMEEAAISRLFGGIHYRSDIEVGKDHGRRVGGYTVRFAQTDGADVQAAVLPLPVSRGSFQRRGTE